MANKLKNTAKRGRPAPSQVTFYDSSFDIPELAGKRRQINDVSAENGNEHPQNALENACALVCDYYDYVTKEKFVGLAVCLMWGVRMCKIEVTSDNPKTAVLMYKWPPQFARIQNKLETEVETSVSKHRVYAKIQAFAFAMKQRLSRDRDVPTMTQRVALPFAVEPQILDCNAGSGTIDDDIIVAEFKVPGCSNTTPVIGLHS
ncbi:hypothetical protein AC1031_019515 [Aphanomyces cochlioides]|nr:hypothetical protein AC1031_019515 [Aphanomyces cochlioides]